MVGAAASMLTAVPAMADPVETDGSAAAAVVEPARVRHVSDLRFGAFASPDTNGTLRIANDGTVTPNGGMTTTINVPQPPSGRGPAQFIVEQDGAFRFIAYIPFRIDISNGASNMRVSNMTGRLVQTVNAGRNSQYRLDMGGTLNVAADQPVGSYSGDFTITVLYL